MSDRMVSCVRLFAFRKDISMNNKDRKRQIAYEVLMILGSLALLTFICRLWPILLLIILGIFVAAIRLLFLSGNRVDQVEPQPLLPAPIPAPTESDLRKLAHSLITSRITTLVLNEYPNARCNDAIGQGSTEIILTADDLPARESWENVCLELQRTGLEDAVCIAEGIKINLSH